ETEFMLLVNKGIPADVRRGVDADHPRTPVRKEPGHTGTRTRRIASSNVEPARLRGDQIQQQVLVVIVRTVIPESGPQLRPPPHSAVRLGVFEFEDFLQG